MDSREYEAEILKLQHEVLAMGIAAKAVLFKYIQPGKHSAAYDEQAKAREKVKSLRPKSILSNG